MWSKGWALKGILSTSCCLYFRYYPALGTVPQCWLKWAFWLLGQTGSFSLQRPKRVDIHSSGIFSCMSQSLRCQQPRVLHWRERTERSKPLCLPISLLSDTIHCAGGRRIWKLRDLSDLGYKLPVSARNKPHVTVEQLWSSQSFIVHGLCSSPLKAVPPPLHLLHGELLLELTNWFKSHLPTTFASFVTPTRHWRLPDCYFVFRSPEWMSPKQ